MFLKRMWGGFTLRCQSYHERKTIHRYFYISWRHYLTFRLLSSHFWGAYFWCKQTGSKRYIQLYVAYYCHVDNCRFRWLLSQDCSGQNCRFYLLLLGNLHRILLRGDSDKYFDIFSPRGEILYPFAKASLQRALERTRSQCFVKCIQA